MSNFYTCTNALRIPPPCRQIQAASQQSLQNSVRTVGEAERTAIATAGLIRGQTEQLKDIYAGAAGCVPVERSRPRPAVLSEGHRRPPLSPQARRRVADLESDTDADGSPRLPGPRRAGGRRAVRGPPSWINPTRQPFGYPA